MAKIVKSTQGYWVGKEIYEGHRYMSFGETVINYPTELLVEVDHQMICNDLQKHFHITISENTPDSIIDKLVSELCNSKLGMFYLFDYQSPFGVRKIMNE